MSNPDADEESLEETKTKLTSEVERLEETTDNGMDGEKSGEGDTDAAELLERAESILRDVIKLLSGDATIEEVEDDFEDLHDIAAEARELLATVEITEVPEAIDQDELPEAIEVSDIPEAVAEGDLDEAIRYSELLALIEFDELLDAVDLRAFRQNKDELSDAASEFTADREADDDWVMFDMLKWIVEALGGGDSSGDGLLGSIDGEDVAEDIDGDAKQAAIQSQVSEMVEEFRESVLDARERMKEVREEATDQVEAKTGDIAQPTSRNPTAISTLTAAWKSTGGAGQYSTVPKSTRYSTAVSHPRIYGSRFDNREDNDE